VPITAQERAASIALPELGFLRGSASCDAHAGAHIGFSMRQAGEFSNEKGDTLRSIWAKGILRVSGHYIQSVEVEALSSMSNDHLGLPLTERQCGRDWRVIQTKEAIV
jgi:hypothetical protein